jgi:hypothetical protein
MKVVRPRIKTHEDRIEAFWANVDRSGECWEWLAAKVGGGYGVTKLFYRTEVAHRSAYRLECGEIPDGLVIDHICHNRACVRPSHLRAATHKQNVENHTGVQSNNRSSGVRGVSLCKQTGRWWASVRHHGIRYRLGRFDRLEDAAAAVLAKRLELFTHNDLDRRSS